MVVEQRRGPCVGGVALLLALGLGAGLGCAAAGGGSGGAGGGAGGGGGSGPGPGPGGSGGSGGSIGPGAGGAGGFAECGSDVYEAAQAPAAMLIALDSSPSMAKGGKWSTAQVAIAQAIDKDVFDTMSMGLHTFPSQNVDPPQCLCDYLGTPDLATCKLFIPGVSCGVGALPQIPLAPAGKEKSNAQSGVRRSIYDHIASSSPLTNSDDGSPIYEGLVAGYQALKGYAIDKRILVLITDGGFSCTSLSSPPRPGYTDGACLDWEYPSTVNDLIASARNDAEKPVLTLIIGVPGSNSTGANVDGYATPPYNMRLALSTYAVSGSPDSVDPSCDKSATFTQGGAAPAVPCHVDLSMGGFDADALAASISKLRGDALGCVYDLPKPSGGEAIDKTKVNVELTLEGTQTVVPRRSSPSDTCADAPCWDYDAESRIELLGKGCADVGAAASAKVAIIVGCTTVIK